MEKFTKLNNGITIPAPGFGMFLTPPGTVAVESARCALAAGYTHIDTAAYYKNEADVGQAVRESGLKREDIFITSKLWNTDRGYDNTIRAFSHSLEELGMDYLDLYLIHWPANYKQFQDDAAGINQETWRAFETLYEEGKIRAIGLSNFMPHHIDQVLQTARVMPAVDQIEFHPGLLQKECVSYCKEKGIAVEAWSPLGRGALLDHETVLSIAARHGRTPAQVIIRWVLQSGVIPLVKSVTPARIESNLDVYGFELDDSEMAAIDALPPLRVGTDPDKAAF